MQKNLQVMDLEDERSLFIGVKGLHGLNMFHVEVYAVGKRIRKNGENRNQITTKQNCAHAQYS